MVTIDGKILFNTINGLIKPIIVSYRNHSYHQFGVKQCHKPAMTGNGLCIPPMNIMVISNYHTDYGLLLIIILILVTIVYNINNIMVI
jgi:hypothetical protein